MRNFTPLNGNIQAAIVFNQVKLSQLVGEIGGKYEELDLAPEND
jgi:hypothetical protein